MAVSTQQKGRQAVARLKSWLATHPELPRARGRPNKAEICRRLGIARSTADANPHIRALLAELSNLPPDTGCRSKHPKKTTVKAAIAAGETQQTLRPENLDDQRTLLAIEHLLVTGRVIR